MCAFLWCISWVFKIVAKFTANWPLFFQQTFAHSRSVWHISAFHWSLICITMLSDMKKAFLQLSPNPAKHDIPCICGCVTCQNLLHWTTYRHFSFVWRHNQKSSATPNKSGNFFPTRTCMWTMSSSAWILLMKQCCTAATKQIKCVPVHPWISFSGSQTFQNCFTGTRYQTVQRHISQLPQPVLE